MRANPRVWQKFRQLLSLLRVLMWIAASALPPLRSIASRRGEANRHAMDLFCAAAASTSRDQIVISLTARGLTTGEIAAGAHPVPGLRRRDPEDHLQHECHREPERPLAPRGLRPRPPLDGTGRPEGPLPGSAQPGGLPRTEHR